MEDTTVRRVENAVLMALLLLPLVALFAPRNTRGEIGHPHHPCIVVDPAVPIFHSNDPQKFAVPT